MTRYIFPILIVLIAIVTYEISIQPLYVDIERALAKEVKVKEAIVRANTAQAKLDEIVKRYESFPPDAEERLSEIIPEKIDPIRLLIDTNAFLDHTGFSAKSLAVAEDSVSVEDGVPGAPYQAHLITFTLSGSYDTFRMFLRALEASLALRDPVDIAFTTLPSLNAKAGEKSELAIHDYNIQVTSYSLR